MNATDTKIDTTVATATAVKSTKRQHHHPALKRNRAYLVAPEALTIVGLDTDHGAEHWAFDPRATQELDEAFVKNIAVLGVLKPVLLARDGDDLIVVDGRQRIRAARKVNEMRAAAGNDLLRVRALMQHGSESALMGVAISTNEIRKDDSMLAKAEKLSRFMALGNTEDDAALHFGVSITAIRNWLKLTDLNDDVVEAVKSGKLSASAASHLASFPRDEQTEQLNDLLSESLVSGRKPTTEVAALTVANADDTTTIDPKPAAKPAPKKSLAPRKPTMRKLVKASSEGSVSLDPTIVAMLQWFLGDLATDDIDGLADAIAFINKGNDDSAKLSAPQEAMIEMLKSQGPQPKGKLNGRTVPALIKRNLVEAVEQDGTEWIRLPGQSIPEVKTVEPVVDAAETTDDTVAPF
jgi:ParB-like chromosome segregation protein Spo0J